MTLIRYVFRYHLIGHIAATAAEIPPCPQMSPPKLLVQMRKFPQQLVRRLSLQPLDQSAYRYLWRYRYKQMQMVFGHVPLQDRHFVLPTYLPNQISHSRRHLSCQRPTTIFGRPNQMQMYLENGMRSTSIFLHPYTLPQRTENLLKPSPKGEGFNPPRVGQ